MTAKLSGMYCCSCGAQTECELGDLNIGKYFQCPVCEEVRVTIVPRRGGKVWVTIIPDQVRFYQLLKEPEDEDADAD